VGLRGIVGQIKNMMLKLKERGKARKRTEKPPAALDVFREREFDPPPPGCEVKKTK